MDIILYLLQLIQYQHKQKLFYKFFHGTYYISCFFPKPNKTSDKHLLYV